MNIQKDFLDSQQVISMRKMLLIALDYHYQNYTKFEEEILKGMENRETRSEQERINNFNSHEHIKLELLAYLIHIRRFRYFIKNLKNKGKLKVPNTKEEKEIWDSLVVTGGALEYYANKWAAHRSYDDTRGETKEVHLEMLLNLEGSVIMYDTDGMFFSFGGHELRLNQLHSKIMRFVDYVFNNIC
ncbi:hypothetical protein GYA27_02730 [candidate division WWE3 bacterium]|uniref:Uncharacterized protein n=1 Tax=candidate division WWE3 bacterium TaxID=2053526 RepID=A0A7X9DKH6_UNCKA|nr:hypothetical protein [candidate division WWE3 bacterium]